MAENSLDTSMMPEATVADYQQLATGFEGALSLGKHAPWHRLIYGMLPVKWRVAEHQIEAVWRA